jgi:hypothetical protein
MIPCMIPGCPSEGTRLHGVEVEGSDCLVCEAHYRLYYTAFTGGPGEQDLVNYNRAYQRVLERRKREAVEAAREHQENAEPPAVGGCVEDGAPPPATPVRVPPPSAAPGAQEGAYPV